MNSNTIEIYTYANNKNSNRVQKTLDLLMKKISNNSDFSDKMV